MKNKKQLKVRWKNVFLLLILNASAIILIISGYNGLRWLIDNKKTETQLNKIEEIVEIIEIEDTDKTEIIEQEDIDEANPYWDYIKMNLIDIDFTELKKINPSTGGWIQVSGTNINYPFVQTTNNSYYLNHSFDKSYNGAGWVFLDYRNNLSNNNKNTIIYAHGRIDKTMFGSLTNILTDKWLKNTSNHVIKLSTETENSLWQVFSVYHLPTTNDYIQITFNSPEEFLSFANKLTNRSFHDFETTVNANDQILTLSTCYNDDEKLVLHAKLIKREKK